MVLHLHRVLSIPCIENTFTQTQAKSASIKAIENYGHKWGGSTLYSMSMASHYQSDSANYGDSTASQFSFVYKPRYQSRVKELL